MAGLKIVIEDTGNGVFQIAATQNGNTIFNKHNYIYSDNIVDNMDVVTAWLKSDLRQLKSPVLSNPNLDMVLCLECRTAMWDEFLFKDNEFYKVYDYNYVKDCSKYHTKRALEWNGNIATSVSTESKFILVKNFPDFLLFSRNVFYNGSVVCTEKLKKNPDFSTGEFIEIKNGEIQKDLQDDCIPKKKYRSFKHLCTDFSNSFKFAKIIDKDYIYEDAFICTESKNGQFEPGMIYFVKNNELLSPLYRTVHNKEEVIKLLSRIGVTVKKINWE